MKCFVYRAPGYNPYENLAIEEFFTDYVSTHVMEEIAVLYLWQNEDSVVFGRNQNPADECRLEVMRQLHIHPVRRKTGGGTVFHDLQNLNFSFIVSKSIYDKERSMKILQDALVALGVPAEINGRNDILLNGSKISGSAYASNDVMSLHHGTLLFAVNVDVMSRLLTVDEKKLASKGIRSVRSRVMNLKQYRQDLSITDYEHAIARAFVTCYHAENIQIYEMRQEDLCKIKDLTQMYGSKEWIFGHHLTSVQEARERFSWGSCTVKLIDAGEAGRYYQLYSDTLYADSIVQLQKYLDASQKTQDIRNDMLQKTGISSQICKDVLQLIDAMQQRDETESKQR